MPRDSATNPRDDLLAAFLAAPPPRAVPAEVLRAARGQAASLAFAFIGVPFLLMGLFFAWTFVPWRIQEDWTLNAADTASAPAQVVAVSATSLSINKRRVYHYEFTFLTPAGGRVRGECYTTGSSWRAGDSAVAQYRPDHPALCRLAGARRSEASGSAFLVLLFPAIGALFIGTTLWSRWGLRALLERGQVVEARVTGVERTNVQVNRQTVYRITLQRTDAPDGPGLTTRRYQAAVVSFAQQRRDSNQPVFVLYDPAKPRRLLLPETLI